MKKILFIILLSFMTSFALKAQLILGAITHYSASGESSSANSLPSYTSGVKFGFDMLPYNSDMSFDVIGIYSSSKLTYYDYSYDQYSSSVEMKTPCKQWRVGSEFTYYYDFFYWGAGAGYLHVNARDYDKSSSYFASLRAGIGNKDSYNLGLGVENTRIFGQPTNFFTLEFCFRL